MAKYTYESIMSELRSGVYRPVYYLMGEEGYFTDRITDYIIENVLTEVERDFNLTVFYGLETDINTVINTAKRFPMMAEHQVVVVKEAQALKDLDPLVYYLQNPQPTTVLVFAHKNGSIDKRKKVATELDRNGVVLDTKKYKDDHLPSFISSYLKEKGLTADPKSVLMLRESIGADLARIAGEIDKLSISLPQGALAITPELVEEHIGISKEYNNFELQNAIINKDIYKANKIINYFAQNPKKNPIQMTLALLFSFFSNLMMCYYAPEKTERGIMEFLGLKNSWGVNDYLKAMRNYRAMHVMDVLHLIRLADAQSKGAEGAQLPDGEIMRELLYKILH
ncbi:MAG: DNA polymerase III subunit delta [Bacteroidaceae bacterium]|nr:DNA polymerase III subunit delta [Bacteroidaceae bacterium]